MSAKKAIEILGSVLAFSGVVFILSQLISYVNQLGFDKLNLTQWFYLFVLCAIYSMISVFLALAWHALLQKYELNVGWRWAVYIYGKTQIIKYVPGNIFHLASRQAEGQQAGLPASPLAKTVMWEILCIASAALPFAPILLTQFGLTITLSGCLALFVLAAVEFTWFKANIFLFKATGLYLGFLLCSGLLFYFLTLISTTINLQDWELIIVFPSIYIVAWLAGFITPGAPAGLGVRELVLIFFTTNYLSEAEVITLIILSRFSTGLGDTLFFFWTRPFKTSNKIL